MVSVFPPTGLNAKQVVSSNGYALLIEQTPIDGGTVTPGLGVHEHEKNAVLGLRAVPKPGFKFLYWLGDVEEMEENETSVEVDSPKIIVAVFSRTESIGGGVDAGSTISRGRTTLRNSGSSVRNKGAGRGAKPRDPVKRSYTPFDPFDLSDPSDLSDLFDLFNLFNQLNPPEEEVPEPATLLIFGVGSLMVMKTRRKKTKL
jgi:hypothetical protein